MGRTAEIDKSRHYKNLVTGPKVYLDGKPYVKVKLRFVDTLDYDTSKHLDQLETEIEFQRLEIERLSLLIENFETKIETLQLLNINLQTENRINTNKLNKTIAGLTHENESRECPRCDRKKSGVPGHHSTKGAGSNKTFPTEA